MSEQLGRPLHLGVLPDGHLVVGVAVAGDELLVVLRPDQGANLNRKGDIILRDIKVCLVVCKTKHRVIAAEIL